MSQSEEEMLRELRASVLFEPDFPMRIPHSHGQREAVPQQAIEASHRPELEAIERARSSFRHLEELVRRLGIARYQPAVPTLAQLWRECALVPVRVAAGHALFAMRSEEARDALVSMIEDADQLHFSVFMGVRAVFDRNPDQAYDYFEKHFREADGGSSVVGREALSLFCPSTYRFTKDGGQIPGWDREPRAPEWLKGDSRWLQLCARLRRDEVFGDIARRVLRHADRNDALAVLAQVRRAEPPQQIKTRNRRIGDLLARYQAGEFQEVWREIRSHPSIAGQFREEVQEVAEATMQRVARNADLVTERLRARGWRALTGRLRTKPASDDQSVFERIEAIAGGPLPPSLRAFWTVVGGIDWVWDYESGDPIPDLGLDLPMDEMDPLCVHAPSFVTYLFDEWEEQRNQPDPDLVDPFRLDLAPDYLHKANISGGSPYGVELPFLGGDPPFANERHNLPFVDYLRLCFQWAGFPGLEQHAGRRDVERFVREFGRDIEPF